MAAAGREIDVCDQLFGNAGGGGRERGGGKGGGIVKIQTDTVCNYVIHIKLCRQYITHIVA